VLVEIFFYVNINRGWDVRNPWHALVNVCRRWRYVVYSSPRRLDLRFEYRGYGPMLEVPDAWQALPVILTSSPDGHPSSRQRWDNRVAALESEHYNRICEIDIFDMTSSRWERFTAAMQKPFPKLTYLQVSLSLYGNFMAPVLPDSFLGGSAPRLRDLSFNGIPFPSMPKLLLSANGLVTLTLEDIPDSGYFSPEAMATALTVMFGLEVLRLQFRFPHFLRDPESRPLLPPTRFVLPALTELAFHGDKEYLEILLAQIDVPLLYEFYIAFHMDIDFDVPQLHRLIGHAEEFKACDHAEVLIFDGSIQLSLYPKTRVVNHFTGSLLVFQINCGELDWQLLSLSRACNSSFPLISALEVLEISESDDLPISHWEHDGENVQWLGLLDPFTAVKDLYLTDEIARRVHNALQELSGERAIEVLPALRNIFVDAPGSLEHTQEAIRPFLSARQLSGHPVAIEHWRRGSVFEA